MLSMDPISDSNQRVDDVAAAVKPVSEVLPEQKPVPEVVTGVESAGEQSAGQLEAS